MRNRYLFVLFSLLAVLAACGGDSDTPKTNNTPQASPSVVTPPATLLPTSVPALTVSTNDPDSWAAGLTEPVAGLMRLPNIEGARGRLAFSQGTDLYLAAFDNQRAQQVATLINPYSLSSSPDGRHLLYLTTLTYQDPPNAFQLLDTTTLATTTLLSVSTPYARVLGWSTDGQWVAIVAPQQLTLVELTTHNTIDLLVPNNRTPRLAPYPPAAWLTDNRLLYTVPRSPDQLSLVAYDPTTQTATPLDLSLSSETPLDFGALGPQLAAQGLSLAPTANLASNGAYIQPPQAVGDFAPNACDTWAIRQGTQALYQVQDAAFISQLNPLPDDKGYLFLAWRLPMCSADSHMQIWLLWQQPNGTIRLISERILPETTRDLGLLLTQQSQRYTLIPNGRYVIWIAGSAWSQHASLEITDLYTGQHGILMQVAAPSPVNLFTNIVWIPTDG